MKIKIENIRKYYELAKSKSLPFLKSKIAKISGGVFLSIFLLIYTLPFFLDNSSLKFQISHKVGELLGANLSAGDLDIALLPSPRITLHDTVIQNYKAEDSENINIAKIYNFHADKITVKLPIFNFSGDFRAKEIILKNASLERYYDNGSADIRDNFLTTKIEKTINLRSTETADIGSGISGDLFSVNNLKPSKNPYNVPKITVKNGLLITYDAFGRKREIRRINGKLLFSKKKLITKGSFLSEGFLSKVKSVIKFKSDFGDNDSFIKITSPVLKLTIEGDFTLENKLLDEGFLANNFRGKITADIAELRSFYRTYLNNVDIVANRLKYSHKPIVFTSDVAIKDQELFFENLSVKSTLFEGRGEVIFSKRDNKSSIIDVDFALENIDLDALWASNSNHNKSSKSKSAPIRKANLDLTRNINNLDLNIEIEAKNIKYLNGQIRNTSLYLAASNEGKILVMPLIFEVPGQGTLRINGIIDNDQLHPKFIGKIDGNGENLGDSLKWLDIKSQNLKFNNLNEYTLYSNILVLPDSISLNNLYLSLNNNESEILGQLTVSNFGKHTNNRGRFRISKINIDDYFFTSEKNIYLSPGSLLKKFLWLNSLSATGEFDLGFDKLIYKGEVFKNQKTKFKFHHGFLQVYQKSLHSDKIDLQTSLIIDISKIIPKFELTIAGNKLHRETPQVNFIGSNGSVSSTGGRNFFDQIYALPSIEDFHGKININIADLKLDGVAMKDFDLGGEIKNGNITNAKSSFGIYGGNLDYSGFLGIKLRKTINGNITLTNANINPLLNDIFGINNIYGTVNLSSSITSIADSKKGFLKRLSNEIRFNANAPYIKGYGLSSLIQKMIYRRTFSKELRDPAAILLDKNSKTIFKKASGSFKVSVGKNPKLKVNLSAPALNAILSGELNPSKNSLNLLFNAIFLTGNNKQQTPINIATSIKGKIDKASQNTNLDQAKQYLGLIKAKKIEKKTKNVPVKPSPNDSFITYD